MIDTSLRAIVREELRAAFAEERAATVAAVVAEVRKLGTVELLTVAEAAELAHVHPRTVRRWVETGRLPRHMAGADIRVVRAELLEMLGLSTAAPATGQTLPLTDDEVAARVAKMLGST